MSTIASVGIAKGVIFIKISKGMIGTDKKLPKGTVLVNGGSKPAEGTPEEIDKKSVNSKRIKVQKEYIPRDSLKKIMRLDQEIEAFIEKRTLPGVFGLGERAVAVERFKYVDERVLKYIEERSAAVDQFMLDYPGVIEQAQQELGPLGLFNPEDYLTPEQARDKFYVRYQPFKLNVPNDLPEEVFRREQEKAAAQWQEAAGTWRNEIRLAIFKIVQHMNDRLTPDKDGKKKRFEARGMVEKFQNALQEFPFLDVTNDQELQVKMAQLKELQEKVTVESLEDDEATRRSIAEVTGKIMEEMLPMVSGAERMIDV